MKTEKARIATIQLGNLEIEGLMLPNGDFAIGISQINATRTVKSLLGRTSPLLKIKSELHNSPVNYVLLTDLEKIIVLAASKSSHDALNLCLALVGCTLNQFWCDAFGVRFDQEERVQFVASRMEHLKNFHPRLTIWWKQDGCISGKDYQDRVVQFKEICGLSKYKKVEHMDEAELKIINQKETAYHALRRSGLDHEDALKYV